MKHTDDLEARVPEPDLVGENGDFGGVEGGESGVSTGSRDDLSNLEQTSIRLLQRRQEANRHT